MKNKRKNKKLNLAMIVSLLVTIVLIPPIITYAFDDSNAKKNDNFEDHRGKIYVKVVTTDNKYGSQGYFTAPNLKEFKKWMVGSTTGTTAFDENGERTNIKGVSQAAKGGTKATFVQPSQLDGYENQYPKSNFALDAGGNSSYGLYQDGKNHTIKDTYSKGSNSNRNGYVRQAGKFYYVKTLPLEGYIFESQSSSRPSAAQIATIEPNGKGYFMKAVSGGHPGVNQLWKWKMYDAAAFNDPSTIPVGWDDRETKEHAAPDKLRVQVDLQRIDDKKGDDVTITVKYRPINYTIRYNENGGTGSTADSTHKYNEAKNLTKNGFVRGKYKFVEWNTKADGTGIKYEDEKSVLNLANKENAVIELYAVWQKNEFTMTTYHKKLNVTANKWNDAFKTTTATALFGTVYKPSYLNPNPTGYLRHGIDWENGWTVSGDGTFNAYYSPITYYIKYNGNKSTSGSMIDSTHRYDAEKPLTSNAFKREYTITYDSDGNKKLNVDTQSVVRNSKDSEVAKAVFNGWSNVATGNAIYGNNQSVVNLSSTNGATVNLYANWTLAKVNLPTPVRDGYIFKGWTADKNDTSNLLNGQLTPDKDIQLYAVWEPITYMLHFEPNPNPDYCKGKTTGEMENIILTYDKPINLPKNLFVKTTMNNPEEKGGNEVEKTSIFVGWNIDATVFDALYEDEEEVVNLTIKDKDVITLYAIWDDAPTFILGDEFPDRWFTVSQAQAGEITADELLSTVTAIDRETSPFNKATSSVDPDGYMVTADGGRVGISMWNYSPNEFPQFVSDGSSTITYEAIDARGNKSKLTVTVYITSTDSLPVREVSYIRNISKKYYGLPQADGGLNEKSKWMTDPEYNKILQDALNGTGEPIYQRTFTAEDINTIRDYIEEHGFGNSEEPDALENMGKLFPSE